MHTLHQPAGVVVMPIIWQVRNTLVALECNLSTNSTLTCLMCVRSHFTWYVRNTFSTVWIWKLKSNSPPINWQCHQNQPPIWHRCPLSTWLHIGKSEIKFLIYWSLFYYTKHWFKINLIEGIDCSSSRVAMEIRTCTICNACTMLFMYDACVHCILHSNTRKDWICTMDWTQCQRQIKGDYGSTDSPRCGQVGKLDTTWYIMVERRLLDWIAVEKVLYLYCKPVRGLLDDIFIGDTREYPLPHKVWKSIEEEKF